MYSTLLTDEEYDPLLMVFLTTTGATLQNHVRSQLIKESLRRVVFQEAGEYEPFNTLNLIAGSLETKRQQDADLRAKKASAASAIATLNTVPGAIGATGTSAVAIPSVGVTGPTGTTP